MEIIRALVRIAMVVSLAAASFCSFKASAVPSPKTAVLGTFMAGDGASGPTPFDEYHAAVARFTKAAAAFSGLAAALVALDFLLS